MIILDNVKKGDIIVTVNGDKHVVKEVQHDIEPDKSVIYLVGNKQIFITDVVQLGV